jgi:hypothetical protein
MACLDKYLAIYIQLTITVGNLVEANDFTAIRTLHFKFTCMILEIKKDSQLNDIQDSFTHNFPFLRLQFYSMEVKHKNRKNKVLYYTDLHTSIKEAGHVKHDLFLELHYWQKTGTVEKLFRDKTGLHVHVYRKHGDHWIQTAGTDELTLEEQNNIGRKDTQEKLHGNNRPVEIEKLL